VCYSAAVPGAASPCPQSAQWPCPSFRPQTAGGVCVCMYVCVRLCVYVYVCTVGTVYHCVPQKFLTPRGVLGAFKLLSHKGPPREARIRVN
jgi:hypothetical protein